MEEGIATHSSILAWRIPMNRGIWWATVHRVAKSQLRLKQLSMHIGDYSVLSRIPGAIQTIAIS